MNYCARIAILLSLAVAAGCGGGSSGSSTLPPSLSVALSSNTTAVYQNQSAATVNVLLTRTGTTGNVTLTLQGVPPSVSTQIQQPGTGNSGSVVFTAMPPASPPNLGNFTVTISASDGQASGSATTPLTVGAYAQVTPNALGQMKLAMSTSFQPAEWDSTFFNDHPTATTPLGNLQASHIRLQPVSQGVPESAQDVWNFSVVDAITQPVLNVGDMKPEFQIATAPAFMYDASHNFLDPTYAQFAAYTQQLVSYYNKGGFDLNGTHYQSPSVNPINWWGIYNEPNLNNLDAAQYTTLYNAAVPAMQTVDPGLRFVAVELSDFGTWEQDFLPTFATNVTATVDVLATHFYSSCNQKDSDQQIFDTVPGFGAGVANIYSILTAPTANPALQTVPVWVTENNVNADFDQGGGISACNGTPFVIDQRGSSAFFAAWRPYVFSQLGKAGTAALYQWTFAGDAQYGELDANTGTPRLSYWVDYWLAHKFPAPPGTSLLQYSATDDAELEALAVQNSDNSIVVMVANHAVNAPADNNGPGAPRGILIDVSQFAIPFQTATVLTIDANTNLTNGPTETTVGLAAQIPVTLNGYGVAFLTLK
jgi:hypothetical protein